MLQLPEAKNQQNSDRHGDGSPHGSNGKDLNADDQLNHRNRHQRRNKNPPLINMFIISI